MCRRMILLVLLWLCIPFCARAEGVNRALLVGCDLFITQEDTSPSSENNVHGMAQALSGGAMNLESLFTRTDGLTSASELEALVLEAFAGAQEGDVSYFYISTHGVWRQGQPTQDMTLLLSDGKTETGVTARRLRQIFDQIPGTKVLMIDACHAGAMIGKGVHPPYNNVFTGPDYKVICSSGGAEESWYWSGSDMAAEGYFSGALISALSAKGGFGADNNRDGVITLTELKHYLLQNHGASTVRTYPEEDDFPLLTYDASAFTRRSRAVENVFFSGNVLTADDPEIAFTFNMIKSARIAYQLTYLQRGRWAFGQGDLSYDNAERFGTHGDVQGYLSPGMKERSISLQEMDELSYGYVLLEMLAIENNMPSVITSQVLCVPPLSGDPALEILPAERFCPSLGEEMTFVVHHQYPCELTVTIEDMEGKTIRRLASRQGTRPEQLEPAGSAFCWNGRTASGAEALPGEYRIRVKAYVGDEIYEQVSDVFELMEPLG